jgi:hypothetical protein
VAKLRDTLSDDRFKCCEVTNIGLSEHYPAVELLHQLYGLVNIGCCRQRIVNTVDVAANVDRDDIRPLLGQASCVRPSLPACRSGDESDLSQGSVHDVILSDAVY